MLTRRLNSPVCVAAALLLGSILFEGTAHAQALVKVTPLGSHAGELCAADRALLFEDPTGLRILYDPGATTDETDPRLGAVHIVLVSHAHGDMIGTTRLNRASPGTCAAPAGTPNPNSNAVTIAAAKNAAVFATLELAQFMGAKIQGIRGAATPACATFGPANETAVTGSSPCLGIVGVGGSRTVRRGGAAAVRITGVQAAHGSSIPAALIDPPGLPPGTAAYGGIAQGYVVRFTNGLTAYLTGDTGMFADMGQVIQRFYRPNLVVINMGAGTGSMGSDEAVNIIQYLVKPTTVMPSHVNEQATSGGAVLSGTFTELFTRGARAFVDVVLPLSDVTLAFDGEGRCIGCGR